MPNVTGYTKAGADALLANKQDEATLDADVASKVTNSASTTRGALNGIYHSKSVLDARDYITSGTTFNLQQMVTDVEATGKAIYIPGGQILTPSTYNITLNSAESSFTYRIVGDTKKSRITLPAGMVDGDFLFRCNLTSAGVPVSEDFLQTPRVVMEDLVVLGGSSPLGGLLDTYKRSFTAKRIQLFGLKRGFRTNGYCDLNRLEQITAAAVTGWVFEQQSNGDGLVIQGLMAYASGGVKIKACQGGHLSGFISGWHQIEDSDVTLSQWHMEGDGTTSATPLLLMKGSRVHIPDGRWYTTKYRNAIEIDDSSYSRQASKLTLGHGMSFTQRLDGPAEAYGAVQGTAIHLLNASTRTRIRFQSIGQELYGHSSAGGPAEPGFERILPKITAADSTLNTVINARKPLLAGDVELRYINGAWEVDAPEPNAAMRSFRRADNPPSITAAAYAGTGWGTDLAAGTYYYRVWTRNTENMDTSAATEVAVTTDATNKVPRLTITGIVGPAMLRIARSQTSGSYSTWVDIPVPDESITLRDQGTCIGGHQWTGTSFPGIPTTNDTRDGYRMRQTGRRVVYGSAIPTSGTYDVGDRMINTVPAAGGAPGWVCTTAGTPGTWKAMANLAA